jgi:thioredoxin 1
MSIKEVNENDFSKEVLESDVPVLVEFGASWCGPCQRQLPVLEKLSSEFNNKLKVVKVDIDDSPSLSNTYFIKSVPTLISFHKGQKLESKSGLSSLDDIKVIFLKKMNLV